MPTNIPSTMQLLLWVVASLGLLGLIAAAAALVGVRRAKVALAAERARASAILEKHALAEAARRSLEQRLSTLQLEIDDERGGLAEDGVIRLPFPRSIREQHETSVPGGDWQAKLQQLEASLAQARRDRDASEQALKQSKLQVQRRQLEVSKLASQVDDLALNLEETRILVTEKDRQIFEYSRQSQVSESEATRFRGAAAQAARDLENMRREVESLRETNLRTSTELQQSRQEIVTHLSANARTEQLLQQARTALHQRESSVGDTSQQVELLTNRLAQQESAYAALERLLNEATASELQLRQEFNNLSNERGQLETQNFELKYILDQVGVGFASQGSPAKSGDSSASAGTWPTVSESDVRGAVVRLQPVPSVQPALAQPTPHGKTVHEEQSDLERELRDARLRVQLLESGKGDLEYLREQNARLNDELLQDRGAARELTALQLEHKRLKLDLQLAEQRLSAQVETIERLSHVASELQDQKDALELLGSLRAQVRDLRAENFALRNVNSGTYRVPDTVHLHSDARELAVAPLDTAVLSDHLGLPVAVTGNLPAESLAAVSGIAAQIATHVRELLPIGPISTVQWVDQYGMTVTCRLFKLAGDDMAMTALASGNPSEETLKETLKEVLHSIGWSEDGPQTGVPDTAVG